MVAVPAELQAQLERRSVSKLREPGPDNQQLELILRAATTVPDHGNLHPWRFVVVRGAARSAFGEALGRAGDEALGPDDERAAKLRGKAFIAPTLVVLIAVPKPSPKVPLREQESSASCTGYAMVLAAHKLGLGAVWKSAPFLDGESLTSLLALQPGERVLGWVNLGQRKHPHDPAPPRVDLADVVVELDDDTSLRPYTA
jgi:nitroreductase